ncbi:MAG: hypothetical protein MK212_00170 [Saprospiraceae bacterium]|nr:hypothetical protein [Saprospiraceae bacterium]
MLHNSYFYTCLMAGAMLFLLAMQNHSTEKDIVVTSRTLVTVPDYIYSSANKEDLEKLKEQADEQPNNEQAQLAYAQACFVQKGVYWTEAEEYFRKVLDAEHTSSEAKAKSAYALACLAIAQKTTRETEYLALAYTHGFRDYQLLLVDPHLQDFREQKDFLLIYADLFNHNSSAMFHAYLSEFPKRNVEKEFQVQVENLYTNTNSKKELSGIFDDFAPGVASAMFGRKTTEDFYVEEELVHTRNYKTVIYSNVDTWTKEQNYLLVTYMPNGELIDKLTIANSNFRSCTTVEIDENLSIELTEYDVVWKDNIHHKSITTYLEKNDIEQLIAKTTYHYSIDDFGKFFSEQN